MAASTAEPDRYRPAQREQDPLRARAPPCPAGERAAAQVGRGDRPVEAVLRGRGPGEVDARRTDRTQGAASPTETSSHRSRTVVSTRARCTWWAAGTEDARPRPRRAGLGAAVEVRAGAAGRVAGARPTRSAASRWRVAARRSWSAHGVDDHGTPAASAAPRRARALVALSPGPGARRAAVARQLGGGPARRPRAARGWRPCRSPGARVRRSSSTPSPCAAEVASTGTPASPSGLEQAAHVGQHRLAADRAAPRRCG